MKIGFFIPSYLPNIGGAEIALHNYLINLNQNKKLSVYLLISFETWVKMKLNRVSLPYQVKVIYFPLIFRIYKYTPSIAKFVINFFLNFYHNKLKINIWHIIMMHPTATVCCDYFSNKEIPWVVRAIGVDIQTHQKLKYGYRINNKIDSIIVNKGTKASAYIASSKDVLKEYLALNIHSSKLYEIPNSVKLSLFQNYEKLDNNFRKKYKISQDEKIFLTVGRNHKKKGFSILLKAIKNFKKRNKLSRAKFVFYGTNLMSLKKISIDLNISKECIFLEEKNNVSDFYDYFPNKQLREVYLNADFFICPSIIESFGIVIVEAMAAGLPIIASNAKGCRNILDNGKYGLQFSVDNEIELSNCIHQFYNDSNLVKKYKELSLNRAKKYDLDVNLQNILALYNKVISEKK